MFKIRINYTTGDTFGSTTDIETLDYDWNNIDIVKENVQAIKEHYQAYEETHDSYFYLHGGGENREWYKSKWWYRKPKDAGWMTADEVCPVLKLKLDSGETFNYTAPWIGYFESLGFIEIIVPC